MYLLLYQSIILSSIFHRYLSGNEKKILAMEKENLLFSRCHYLFFHCLSSFDEVLMNNR